MFDIPVLSPRVFIPTPVDLLPACLPALHPIATSPLVSPAVRHWPARYPNAVFPAPVLVPKADVPIPIALNSGLCIFIPPSIVVTPLRVIVEPEATSEPVIDVGPSTLKLPDIIAEPV